MNDYSDYKYVYDSDPNQFGECTQEQASIYAVDLANLVERNFPGIQIEHHDAVSKNVLGPDDEICDEIGRWIEDNWMSIL